MWALRCSRRWRRLPYGPLIEIPGSVYAQANQNFPPGLVNYKKTFARRKAVLVRRLLIAGIGSVGEVSIQIASMTSRRSRTRGATPTKI